jgi:hypothetical protein
MFAFVLTLFKTKKVRDEIYDKNLMALLILLGRKEYLYAFMCAQMGGIIFENAEKIKGYEKILYAVMDECWFATNCKSPQEFIEKNKKEIARLDSVDSGKFNSIILIQFWIL